MTEAEKTIERIKNLPVDPEYKYEPNVPIPLGKGVLVKKIEKHVQTITTGGILLAQGENTPEPHMGIIQAVGPLCSEFVRPGLRCYYNFFVDSSFYVGGKHYAKMDEHDVYYLIPPDTAVFEAPDPAHVVRRKKKQGESDSYLERKYKKDQEDKDNAEFAKKSGRIKIIKP